MEDSAHRIGQRWLEGLIRNADVYAVVQPCHPHAGRNTTNLHPRICASSCHPRVVESWIPAFAGMTCREKCESIRRSSPRTRGSTKQAHPEAQPEAVIPAHAGIHVGRHVKCVLRDLSWVRRGRKWKSPRQKKPDRGCPLVATTGGEKPRTFKTRPRYLFHSSSTVAVTCSFTDSVRLSTTETDSPPASYSCTSSA